MSDIPPYPLHWPESMVRSTSRISSAFKATLAQARDNVFNELRLFGKDTGKTVSDVVLSSNLLALGGQPADTGVAVWFMWENNQRCIAVDRYEKVQDNLQAIHHIISARRTEMRHGGLHIVRATFKGFTALPAPAGSAKPWTEVLGLSAGATREQISSAYRNKAKALGESQAKLLALNLARDAAIADAEPR